jgi:hypothetical protein
MKLMHKNMEKNLKCPWQKKEKCPLRFKKDMWRFNKKMRQFLMDACFLTNFHEI